MRAVSGAKGIVNVNIAKRCKLFRKFWIVFFLSRVKPEVLEQRHLASVKPLDLRFDFSSNTIRCEEYAIILHLCTSERSSIFACSYRLVAPDRDLLQLRKRPQILVNRPQAVFCLVVNRSFFLSLLFVF